MEFNRQLTLTEKNFLDYLISKASISLPKDCLSNLLVRTMDDGGMGSLLLFPAGNINPNRKLGQTISEFQFKDEDGIDVIASLNLDQEGNLFELDVWKTNFDKLIKLPELGES
jgi:hypothetical protein